LFFCHRNKAIKALDERLQKVVATKDDSAEWPDLDEEQQVALKPDVASKSVDDAVSTSSGSSPSDIVRIDVESSPSEENAAP